jgi:hypothetical protein
MTLTKEEVRAVLTRFKGAAPREIRKELQLFEAQCQACGRFAAECAKCDTLSIITVLKCELGLA